MNNQIDNSNWSIDKIHSINLSATASASYNSEPPANKVSNYCPQCVSKDAQIAELTGKLALQADALDYYAKATTIYSMHGVEQLAQQTISASAETVAKYKAELRNRLASIESAAQDEIDRLNEQKRVLAEKLEAAQRENTRMLRSMIAIRDTIQQADRGTYFDWQQDVVNKLDAFISAQPKEPT